MAPLETKSLQLLGPPSETIHQLGSTSGQDAYWGLRPPTS